MQLLFDNFTQLADAPNGVPKLRELILQLAVMGKLVPQNPDDEPASEILKKLELKKLSDNSNTIKLPSGWEWIKFDKVVLLKHGHQFRNYDFVAQGIPVIKITQCKVDGSLDLSNCDYIDSSREKEFENFKIYEGDILMALTGGTLGKVTKVGKDYGIVVQNYRVGKFISDEKYYDKDFTVIILRSKIFQRLVQEQINQSAQPNIGKEKIDNLIIPLPPIKEQKRIVAKVDQLMALCDQLEKQKEQRDKKRIYLNHTALNKLLTSREPLAFQKHWQRIVDHFDLLYDVPENVAELKKAILQLAVMGKLVPQNPADEPASELLKRIHEEKKKLIREGKIKKDKPLPPIADDEIPYELPKGWEWSKLKNLSKNIHYGYTASADSLIKDIRIVRITDIQNNKVNWETVPGCIIDKDEISKFILNKNDILIARTGGTIGKSYLVNEMPVKAVFASYLIRVIPTEATNSIYIKLFFESPLYWNQLIKKSMGTGQPNVNGVSLSNLVIPLPPIEEQKRIVAKVDALMKLCDDLEEKLKQSRQESERLLEAVVQRIIKPK